MKPHLITGRWPGETRGRENCGKLGTSWLSEPSTNETVL